jgi:Domain of unknown function (DUF4411)
LTVYVLDACSIIAMKSLVAVADQWDFFKGLERLVVQGEIAIPIEVIREVAEGKHPDMPGAWARGMQAKLTRPLQAPPDVVRDVMHIAPDVIDADSQREQADPYVLALAMHLRADVETVHVVTDDRIDRRPIKISVVTACERLGLTWMATEDFLLVA